MPRAVRARSWARPAPLRRPGGRGPLCHAPAATPLPTLAGPRPAQRASLPSGSSSRGLDACHSCPLRDCAEARFASGNGPPRCDRPVSARGRGAGCPSTRRHLRVRIGQRCRTAGLQSLDPRRECSARAAAWSRASGAIRAVAPRPRQSSPLKITPSARVRLRESLRGKLTTAVRRVPPANPTPVLSSRIALPPKKNPHSPCARDQRRTPRRSGSARGRRSRLRGRRRVSSTISAGPW